MVVTSNMPRLALKRAFQNIIIEDLGLLLNEEQHKAGVSESVVCWLTGMEESFEPVRGGNAFKAELIINFQVFSQLNETGVHKAICDLINIDPTNQRLQETGIQIADISPVSSETLYEDDSSDGMVVGTLALKITYLARF
ncbi:hypothetical protein [Providencia sp. JUb39]|uniref:hypothetical protein n=1 Tax=Providencia sp. JUb39 TaxID=2724165 RepID=UPI00164ECD4D|nr:hypothetical protein [Providencia sp. JUb39]MBC5790612.1 hypothetical protein [Providencia sp. JUb39]